jgi:hypothetical protein
MRNKPNKTEEEQADEEAQRKTEAEGALVQQYREELARAQQTEALLLQQFMQLRQEQRRQEQQQERYDRSQRLYDALLEVAAEKKVYLPARSQLRRTLEEMESTEAELKADRKAWADGGGGHGGAGAGASAGAEEEPTHLKNKLMQEIWQNEKLNLARMTMIYQSKECPEYAGAGAGADTVQGSDGSVVEGGGSGSACTGGAMSNDAATCTSTSTSADTGAADETPEITSCRRLSDSLTVSPHNSTRPMAGGVAASTAAAGLATASKDITKKASAIGKTLGIPMNKANAPQPREGKPLPTAGAAAAAAADVGAGAGTGAGAGAGAADAGAGAGAGASACAGADAGTIVTASGGPGGAVSSSDQVQQTEADAS